MKLELDKRLIELTKEYDKLDNKYGEIEEEIEQLEDEKDALESEMVGIGAEIDDIKKQLLKIKIEELDQLNMFTDNVFVNDFIKASYFCNKDTHYRRVLECVNITESVLMGCDGYKAIVIRCSEIPENLKNTKIKWDVREDFENHIDHEFGEYVNVNKIIMDAEKQSKHVIQNVTSESFYNAFNIHVIREKDRNNDIKLCHESVEVILNQEFVDTALMCLKGHEFTVYLTGKIDPILLKNENMAIVILPMKY